MPTNREYFQEARNASKRHLLFDVSGIEFMGPFSPSHDNLYILMAVDYFSKLVESIVTPTNDAKVVTKFLKKNIFTRFSIPRALLSDNEMHFCNKPLELLLKKYGVFYKVATPYHPQTRGQVEPSNCELKSILERRWIELIKISHLSLMMLFRYIALPSRHPWAPLHIGWYLENLVICRWNWSIKWYWIVKNFDLKAAAEKRFLQLCELDEPR